MSDSRANTGPVERITLDDIKHRAETVKDLAVSDVKAAVGRVVSEDATRTLLIVAGVVVAAASIAYVLGSRRGARAFLSDLD